MKKFDIEVLTKIQYCEVKARNEEEAFNKVEKMYNDDFQFDNTQPIEMEIVNINAWQSIKDVL